MRDRNGVHDYSLATFNDLIVIIFSNWELFSNLFGSETKKPVRKPLDKINNGVRRYLAHPHKANTKRYVISKYDFDLLEKMQKWAESAGKKWVSRPKH